MDLSQIQVLELPPYGKEEYEDVSRKLQTGNSASSLYLILARLVMPAGNNSVAYISGVYSFTYLETSGLVPTKDIVPPDVKVETTFFQRKFFITEPCNYPQKIAQKKNLRFLRSPYFTPFL